MLKIIIFIFFAHAAFSQLPETDIWLFKLKKEKEILKLAEGNNFTSRKGYDNQPSFTPDGKNILYVGVYDEKQSDVYKYDIAKKIITQLTKTKESEYSPAYSPDNKSITCITVEPDSVQQIWYYNLDGTRKKCVDPRIDSIGYYTWLNKDTLLYYKLTSPHSLHKFNTISKEDHWICDDPTRAFKKINNTIFIYGIKKDSTEINYRVYHVLNKRSDEYANHKSKSEDFIWINNIGLLKSEGAQILLYNEIHKTWPVLFDFSSYGIKKITRFTFDPKLKFIAIVDNP